MQTLTLANSHCDWPRAAQAIMGQIQKIFEPFEIQLEHIGSTAVPGLCAKPVLDLMLGAAHLSMLEAHVPNLARIGFEYVSKYETEIPLRRYFVRQEGFNMASDLRVHLHGLIMDGELWRQHLHVRDALRADAGLRDAYARLKRALAHTHANDKAAYTEAKAPFIRAVLAAQMPPKGSIHCLANPDAG